MLYSQLLFQGFKKEDLAPNWENTYYGIALTGHMGVFIHKHKAKFSIEDSNSYYNPDMPFVIPVTKITSNSLAIILKVKQDEEKNE